MMKKLMCTTLLLFGAANVFASNDAFNKLDADNDGLISLEEAKVDHTLSAIFNDLDVDQDGYLTNAELEVKTGNEFYFIDAPL